MSRRLWYLNLVSVVIILVFGTLVAERYFLNVDFTEKRLYTLSDATERLVRSLKDRITIKVFFSRDIPYPYNTVARYVLDILRDYRRLSGDKIIVDRVDPESTGFEREAARYGVPPVQVNAIENDQIQIKKVYMGLAFVSADRIESIPVITDVSNLEYEISSTIKYLTTDEKKTIGFVTGHDEQPLNLLRDFLSKQYIVRTINLQQDDPEDADLLIIAGPERQYKDEELFKLDQYILKGGKVLFLIDRVKAELQYGFGRTIDTGLEELLKSYGVEVEPALVYDLSSGVINVSERRGGFIFTAMVRYPFFPKIVELNREEIITRDIETITLGYTSPIQYTRSEDRRIIVLARTTKRSGVLRAPFYVAVERRFSPADFSGPSSVVAVIVAGTFQTGFDKKETEGKEILKQGQSRIIVVGDSEFVSDDFLQAPGNAQFVLNCIDWLLEDDSLISIRSKKISGRPIVGLSGYVQKVVKYAIVLVPPVFTIMAGITVWILKRRRRVVL